MTIRPIATATPTATTAASPDADTGDIFAALLALLQGAPGLLTPPLPAGGGTTPTPERPPSSKTDKVDTAKRNASGDVQPASAQPPTTSAQIEPAKSGTAQTGTVEAPHATASPAAPVQSAQPDSILAKVTVPRNTTTPVTRTPGHSELAPGHLTTPPGNAFGRERGVVRPELPRIPGEHAATMHAEKKTDGSDRTDGSDTVADAVTADPTVITPSKDGSAPSPADPRNAHAQSDSPAPAPVAATTPAVAATTLNVSTDQPTVAPAVAIIPALVPQAVREAMLGLRAANGTTRLVVRLDPPSLGNVHISLHADADGVRLSLHVDNAEAAGALTDQRHHIESALHAEGLNLSDFTVDQQSAQWTGNFDAPGRHNGEGTKRHSSQPAQPAVTTTADTPVEPVNNEGVWL